MIRFTQHSGYTIVAALMTAALASRPRSASASETLCDAAYQNCRTPLLSLINAEQVGIDVSFWFMEGARYSTAIINRWKAGVPVRIMMDSRANPTYPNNATILGFLRDAGIPMRESTPAASSIDSSCCLPATIPFNSAARTTVRRHSFPFRPT